ncbi:hypothetical protein [Asticcacaulis biprosthecium]|uniref:hypothetical protein n=1 Tax=Asticcacaulis biprosthecium TaxID=76891 RepID=UPI001B7FBB16|nr:hypothetical protein [Asticcacaulis biprosthecium]
MLRRLFLSAVVAVGLMAGAAQAEVAVFAGGCFWSTQKSAGPGPGRDIDAGWLHGRLGQKPEL